MASRAVAWVLTKRLNFSEAQVAYEGRRHRREDHGLQYGAVNEEMQTKQVIRRAFHH
jgi:hypothetical protein